MSYLMSMYLGLTITLKAISEAAFLSDLSLLLIKVQIDLEDF